MSNIIQKFKKEKDIIGRDVIKKLVAECLSQRGESQLMTILKNYQDEENSNYVNALHTWSSSKDGRDYWDELNSKVGY